MQDRHITSSDDAQRRLQLSTLYQNQPPDGASPQARPSASSDAFYPNIGNLYIFRETNVVISFLEENPFLMPLLQEAYTQTKEYFPDSDLALEVINSSEAIGEEQLFVFIVVKGNAEEASQEIDHLDQEWWLDNMKRAQDKLCIALEFVGK